MANEHKYLEGIFKDLFMELDAQYELIDSNNESLRETPTRVAKAFVNDWLVGYDTDPASLFTTFDKEGHDGLILVKDIPFYSLCEHHLAPFFGVAHVGYLPGDRIVGLSKIARLVDVYSRRLQVQERITQQVAATLEEHLDPVGVMVVLEARHLCMESRGIQKSGATTTTSTVRGAFLKHEDRSGLSPREEMLQLIGQKGVNV